MSLPSLVSRENRDESRRRPHGGIAAAVLALASVLVLGACQAPLEQKRGGMNEFCNGNDQQCRPGLICEDAVCKSLNNGPTVCDSVCQRFANCDAPVADCKRSCLKTLRYWSPESAQFYRSCYQRTSCSRIAASERPWQICYEKLELADSRDERCEKFLGYSQQCIQKIGGGYNKQLSRFEGACDEWGRTVSSARWSKTETCLQHIKEDGEIFCGEFFSCVNDQFPIMNGTFPTSPPED